MPGRAKKVRRSLAEDSDDEVAEEQEEDEGQGQGQDEEDGLVFQHRKRTFKRRVPQATLLGSDDDDDEDDEGNLKPRKRKRGRPMRKPAKGSILEKEDKMLTVNSDDDLDDDLGVEGRKVSAQTVTESEALPTVQEEDDYAALEREVSILPTLESPAIASPPQSAAKGGATTRSSAKKATPDSSRKPPSTSASSSAAAAAGSSSSSASSSSSSTQHNANVRERLMKLRQESSSMRTTLVQVENTEVVCQAPVSTLGLPEEEKIVVALKMDGVDKPVRFRVYLRSLFQMVFEAFEKRHGVKADDYDFRYNGLVINATDTPSVIGYKEGDHIMVQEKAAVLAAQEAARKAAEAARKTMRLVLSLGHGRQDIDVKFFADDKFETLIAGVTRNFGMQPGELSFHFDGEKLQPNATPESLDMEDEDRIDVVGLPKL